MHNPFLLTPRTSFFMKWGFLTGLFLVFLAVFWWKDNVRDAYRRGDFTLTAEQTKMIDQIDPTQFVTLKGSTLKAVLRAENLHIGERAAMVLEKPGKGVLCAVNTQGIEQMFIIYVEPKRQRGFFGRLRSSSKSRTSEASRTDFYAVVPNRRPGLCSDAVEHAYAQQLIRKKEMCEQHWDLPGCPVTRRP